jgi:xanthine dehydrogenase iron-sulfur cluster and FAD-binding subunit A
MEISMWQETISATSIAEVLDVLAEKGQRARIIAGGTDLILEIERGVRRGIETLVDVTRIPDLDQIILDEDEVIHLGPLVTHNQCVDSKLIVERAFPLARATWEVGAPQIRNRGTVAGNLITASPANDTITPLMAMGARLTLASKRGERIVNLEDFYQGVRQTVMQPDEMLVDIAFPALSEKQRGTFVKVGLRRAQAISLVDAAFVLTMDGEKVVEAAITLGAVAPTIIHAREAQQYLAGKTLDETTIAQAADLAVRAARPISDVRSSASYRTEMVRVSVKRGLQTLLRRMEMEMFPTKPVMLGGQQRNNGDRPRISGSVHHNPDSEIRTRINGKDYVFKGSQHKTLLRLLREDAGLTGTKEGCAEGECGACTVFLDGMAVMSCLVPAARAHEAEIVTVEGLAKDGQLHPVQQAFVEDGAVQCGYCTPGFLMSAAKLIEERPNPTHDEIQQAITGNLCRCTGYYKIVQAIEHAAQMEAHDG